MNRSWPGKQAALFFPLKVLLCWSICASISVEPAFSEQLRFVEVRENNIHIGLPDLGQDVNLACLPGHLLESDLSLELDADSTILRTRANGQVVSVARYDRQGHDRFYDRFWITNQTGHPIGMGRHVDRIADFPDSVACPEWPKKIKGLQDIRDFEDATELGVVHTTLNLPISNLLNLDSPSNHASPEFQHAVDGKVYRFNETRIRAIDKHVKEATRRGINVVAILLCTKPNASGSINPLFHPAAENSRSPNGIVAVNTTTEESVRRYRAIIGFLGKRYTRVDRKHGHIGGYIVGNEVQSHWYWHHLGEQPVESVVRQYADQVRLTYYALKEQVKNPRVFISLDHHWTAMHGDAPQRAIPGRTFLDAFAQDIRERGDIPWHVAWHPYPENLFRPGFWHDKQAWHAFDTPKITFKNVEILPAYLDRKSLRFDGTPRRVILSEQGFHAGDDQNSETLQAAAYAASFVRIRATPGIDAYILHRHIDHPREAGLKVGLRRYEVGKLGEKRKLHAVFQAAETESQTTAFHFALPIVGIEQWSSMLPEKAPFPDQDDQRLNGATGN